jgi:hypothetical protein
MMVIEGTEKKILDEKGTPSLFPDVSWRTPLVKRVQHKGPYKSSSE